MVALLLKASLVILAGATVQRLVGPRVSAATRHFWYTTTVVALLALPLLTRSLPHWYVTVPGPDRPAASAAAAAAPDPSPSAPAPISATPLGRSRAAASEGRDARPLVTWTGIATSLYAAGAFLLIMRLLMERVRARRMIRAAARVSDPDWTALLRRCMQRLGLTVPVALFRTERETMPMALQAAGPAILLPNTAESWTASRREAVLLHELAHVARRDCHTQALAALACALYWPHPGIWWMARRLRIERELACDDRVLAGGTDARDYAEHLLEIAYTLRRQPAPALAVTMAGPGQLEGRLLAVLDGARNRRAPARRTCGATVALASVLLLSIATLDASIVPGPTVGEPAAPVQSAAPAATSPALAGPVAAPAPGVPSPGTWTLVVKDGGRVQLTLGSANNVHGVTVAAASLDGLRPDHLTGTGGPTQFSLRRDAGTFAFDGVVRKGSGGGTFTFTPDAAFATTLTRRGLQRPTDADLYVLALRDIGVAFLDEIRLQGYAPPGLPLLVRSADHGVDRAYVRDMAAAGYKLGTLNALIRLRDHGVDAAYIRALADQGLRGLPPDDVVRARDHGVDADYVRDMTSLGFRNQPLQELVRTRDHGVTPQYVRELAALGFRDLSIDDLIRTRDHGVDTAYIRDMQSLGYRNLTLRELITTRDHGVDVSYVRDLVSLGYRSVPREDLIRLRDHGVTPDRVRTANDRAGTRLGVDELQRLADRGWR